MLPTMMVTDEMERMLTVYKRLDPSLIHYDLSPKLVAAYRNRLPKAQVMEIIKKRPKYVTELYKRNNPY